MYRETKSNYTLLRVLSGYIETNVFALTGENHALVPCLVASSGRVLQEGFDSATQKGAPVPCLRQDLVLSLVASSRDHRDSFHRIHKVPPLLAISFQHP